MPAEQNGSPPPPKRFQHLAGVHAPSLISAVSIIAAMLAVIAVLASRTPSSADALRGVAELVKALAWPAVTLAFLLLLRDQVSQQIGRMRKLKIMEVDVEFAEVIDKELRKTAADVSKAPAGEAGAATPAQSAQAGEFGRIVTDAELPAVKQKVLDLAAEYKRVRGSMVSGDERTRAMGVVAAQMRTLGQAAYAMRRDLAFSREAGERIACMTMLQVQPDYDMLDWLAGRVSKAEVPFAQYQALQALLAAARSAGLDQYGHVTAAYEKARTGYQRLGSDHRTDRSDLLDQVQDEVQWLQGQ